MRDFLRSFLTGAGSVLEIMPAPSPGIERPEFMKVSDTERIASDWQRVGDHLRKALAVELEGHGATQQEEP